MSGSVRNAILLAVFGVVLGVSVSNAVLIFDDLYLDSHFARIDRALSGWSLVEYIVFNPEGRQEYRLYGLARLIHFGLWKIAGNHPAPYQTFIMASQIVSGYGISVLLRRAGADAWQANAAWAVWLFSAFAATSCFHHYSYLVLPYQVTVLCALMLKWRIVSFLLGAAIALTGESHLAASCLIILLAASVSEGRRFRDKVFDVAVPLAAMVAAIVAHRLHWKEIVVQTDAARFKFGLISVPDFLERTRVFARSIVPGMSVQVVDVITFCGMAGVALALLLIVLIWLSARVGRDGSNRLAAGLLAVSMASLVVLWALGVLTGQVSFVLPRRYGFVPYTLVVMTIVVFLLSPWVKSRIGAAPAMVVLAASAGLWGLLQFVMLPTVRAQDRTVWDHVRFGLAEKGPGASVLFVSASNLNLLKKPDIQAWDVMSFRRPTIGIAESPFEGFWWFAQYAISVTGASFAAYRWEEIDEDRIKLFGNEVNHLPARVVERSSVLVMFDEKKVPGDPRTVSIFTEWRKFLEALSASR